MGHWPRHPQVYEINTRVWLHTLSRRAGQRLSLGTVSPETWGRLHDLGMDAVWLMGVWLPSPAGLALDRRNPDLERLCREILPDFTLEDLIGSPYAVAGYSLNPALGADSELLQVRDHLHRAGLGLILDFVPNHTALDHPWVRRHPERFVASASPDRFRPEEAFPVSGSDGVRRWIARGRDPHFPPWPDTAQLCCPCPETRQAMAAELLNLARWCDGLRCDLAMLPLNHVFRQTWKPWMEAEGPPPPQQDYWPEVLGPLKEKNPEFILLAEVYWGLEAELLAQGFNYMYDKSGYDRLRALAAPAFRQRLRDEGARSINMVRFLENHDEERLAAAFPPEAFRAVAVIHATAPGLRLFHHGQLEGRRHKLPVQLGREPDEPVDADVSAFYAKLLGLTRQPLFKQGEASVLSVHPPAAGDEAHQSLVSFAYRLEKQRGVIAVNFSPRVASGFLEFPAGFWQGWNLVPLTDHLSEPQRSFLRSREDLESQGLYVLLGPYEFHFLSASQGDLP